MTASITEIKNLVENRVKAEQSTAKTTEYKSDRFLMECLHGNEKGDANLFNQLNDGLSTFDHAANQWHVWAGHHWKEDVKNEALGSGFDAMVEMYSEEAFRQAWAASETEKAGLSDKSKEHQSLQKKLLGRVRELQALQRRRNVLTLAAAGTGLVGDEWDALKMVLACPNGIIDLKSGSILPGRPEDNLKTSCPTEFKGLAEPCPTWEKFLTEVFEEDQELISYIQRLFGYALTGSATLHIIIILWGTGRNGKGTLLETLKAVLGDYAFKAESELLLEQRQPKASGAPNSGVLSLRGKRLVWTSETDDGRKLNTSRVKELVGGDTLNARAVYGRRHVEFIPSHLLLLLTNNKPQAPASDFALWQRIHLVPFNVAFVTDPLKPNQKNADPFLTEKLKKESSGILAWLVRGCLAYQKQGLKPPEKVKAATERYRQDEDQVGHFLTEGCVTGENCSVKAGRLYKAYQKWCEENGHRYLSGTRFGREMKERFDSYQNYKGVFYIGVGLIDPEYSE
jgi:putative DNA primase/helicase